MFFICAHNKSVLNCHLYYKHMMIVNDGSSVVIKWSFKPIDAARGIIFDRHMFIVQATGLESVNFI
jgi:hypothetical protein